MPRISSQKSSTTLEMSVKNTGFLLDRLGQDCHPLQFLRELTQNSIDAISKVGGKGEIVWDMDWNTYELDGTCKLCIIDNGIGMTGNEMIEYINHLSSSASEQSLGGNYGVGAKVAAATRNHEGVVYLSWKDGEGSMIHLWRDPETKEYGLKQFDLSDGSFAHAIPIEDTVRPEIIQEHGTMVLLFGNSKGANTVDAPIGSPAPSRWIAKYLNSRYFEIPDGIVIKAREGWQHPRGDSARNKLRTIMGQRKYLDDQCQSKGTLDLTRATVHWWILRDTEALSQHSNYIESSGHIAALYQGELFELMTGTARNARLQEFGIIFGCRQVVMYVEPKATDEQILATNTARTLLLLNNQPLPWSDWATEFRESMPEELEAFIHEKGAASSERDHTKSIRERLKAIMDLFKVSRYRPCDNGTLYIDPTSLTEGGQPRTEQGSSRSGSASSAGGRGGKVGNIYALFEKNRGKPGEKVVPDLFPEVNWISTGDGTREAGDIEDKAARYILSQNRLLVNSDFRVFRDMIEYWYKQFSSQPAAKGTVEDVIKAWFEQALVETVIGVQALRSSRQWSTQAIEAALSEEALTTAVMQRYHINVAVKRELHAKFGKVAIST